MRAWTSPLGRGGNSASSQHLFNFNFVNDSREPSPGSSVRLSHQDTRKTFNSFICDISNEIVFNREHHLMRTSRSPLGRGGISESLGQFLNSNSVNDFREPSPGSSVRLLQAYTCKTFKSFICDISNDILRNFVRIRMFSRRSPFRGVGNSKTSQRFHSRRHFSFGRKRVFSWPTSCTFFNQSNCVFFISVKDSMGTTFSKSQHLNPRTFEIS
eukprot:Gb_11354 [translate_table: standard]